MKEYSPSAGLGGLCRLFGKSRQAYYKQQKSDKRDDMAQELIIKRVKEIRDQMPRIGTRKLYHLLAEPLLGHGITIGRDGLFDLLANHGLLVRRRKRRKIYTTNSNHRFKKYPNLIRDLEVVRPEQLWVSDITYIRQQNGFSYLSLVTDAYSRKIVGYCLYPTLQKEGPGKALDMALTSRMQRSDLLIHHSDRGIQYCSDGYTNVLQNEKISISMTEKGDPYENAIAERVNGILKSEFGLDKCFDNYQAALAQVDKVVPIYNQQRPHSSCNYLTPAQAHQQRGKMPSRWQKRDLTFTASDHPLPGLSTYPQGL